MSYNAYNLFDYASVLTTKDWNFYPLKFKKSSAELISYYQKLEKSKQKIFLSLDWTKEVIKKKIDNFAKVIKEISPDILILQEVENKKILNLLLEYGLSQEGYIEAHLINGEDPRAINLAVLSKYKITQKPVLHSICLKGISEKKTRGIFEISFKINNKIITVLANHWPSMYNGKECRDKAAQNLSQLFLKNRSSHLVIAAGDFNCNDDLTQLLQVDQSLEILDCEQEHFKQFPKSTIHRGSFQFKEKWLNFDRILYLNNDDQIIPLYDEYNVLFKSYMKKNKTSKYLKIFNSKTGEGFPDHLPIIMKFAINNGRFD